MEPQNQRESGRGKVPSQKGRTSLPCPLHEPERGVSPCVLLVPPPVLSLCVISRRAVVGQRSVWLCLLLTSLSVSRTTINLRQ